jgi:hypothetical protein
VWKPRQDLISKGRFRPEMARLIRVVAPGNILNSAETGALNTHNDSMQDRLWI